MLYQAVVKELVGLPNVGLVVSLYFVQDCTMYRQYGLRAPICMVCLFSTTIRDMMKSPLQIDREYSITYYFHLKCIRRHE